MGVLYNTLGVALAVLNMAENGVCFSDSLDLAFVAYAFVRGHGWVIPGGCFLIDATIGKGKLYFLLKIPRNVIPKSRMTMILTFSIINLYRNKYGRGFC